MPNFDYNQISDNHAAIQITVTEDELKQKLNTELKKLRKKVDMKGFRKGKAPLSALRKMMGNQVLSEIVDESINSGLQEYIEDHELDLIFAPLIQEGQQVDVDAKTLKDVSISFDLALKPPFDLALPTEPMTRYSLKVDDELIEESLVRLRKQQGEHKELEGPVQAEDIIMFSAQELNKSNKVKKGGIQSDFESMFEDLSEDVQKVLKGKSKDETFKHDIFAFEKNANEHVVRKHFLKLEDDEEKEFNNQFAFTVKGVKRLELAELNEAFFENFDPNGEVTDEASLRERIAKDNKDGFALQGETLLKNQVTQHLVEQTKIDLPQELVDRVRGEEGGKAERFERGIRWMMIRSKYAKEHEIELQPEDLRAASDARLLGMLGGQRPEWVTEEFSENWLKRTLKDEEQRNNLLYDALERKITDHLIQNVEVKEEEVSADRFNEIIVEFNAQQEEEE
ncbi:MAG: trigger factor [Bacteroidota bacterium]